MAKILVATFFSLGDDIMVYEIETLLNWEDKIYFLAKDSYICSCLNMNIACWMEHMVCARAAGQLF